MNIGDITAAFRVIDEATAPLEQIAGAQEEVAATMRRLQDTYTSAAGPIEHYNTLVEEFTGMPLAARANDMALAVESMGGATRLTQQEQTRVNAVMEETLRKYEALGVQAPPAIRDMAEATREAAKATKDAEQGTTGWAVSLASVAQAAAGLAVAAQVKAVIAFTGQLTDLSAQTRITVRDLQVLNDAGSQVGVGMSELALSAQRMSKNLEEGNEKALAGIQKLGLSYAELKAMDPGKQFFAIAAALRQVEDQGKFLSIGTEIMGRGFMRVSALMREDLEKTAKSAEFWGRIMGDDVVKAGDDAGDAMTRFWNAIKSATGAIIGPFLPALTLVVDWIGKLGGGVGWVVGNFMKFITTLGDLKGALQVLGVIKIPLPKANEAAAVATSMDLVSRAAGPLTMSLSEVARVEKDLAITVPKATKEFKDQTTAAERMAAALAAVQINADAVVLTFSTLDGLLVQTTKGGGSAGTQFEFLQWAIAGVHDTTAKFVGLMPALTGNLTTMWNVAVTAGQKIKSGLYAVLMDFPTVVQQALTGGGGFTGALQAVGSKIGSILGSGLFEKLGQSLTGVLGKLGAKVGGAIFDMIPGIGGAIGALVGPLLDKAFGAILKTEGKKVNDLRDAFVSAAGGIDVLNARAQAAGMTLDALLKAKTVKDYEAAVASLNTALAQTAALQGELAGLQAQLAQRQVMDWQKAEEIIRKYGGTLDTLGQQFTAAKLAASWKDVWDDWQTLIDMGADVGGVLVSMKDEIGALVQESLRIGTEIPAQFEPLIKELIRTGQLFDADGKAITDISKLKFGLPLVSEVDKIIAAIDKLILALSTNLTKAFTDLGKIVVPPVTIPYRYQQEGDNPGVPDVPSYAGGTYGRFLNFGSGTLAMLHGREAVVPMGQSGPSGGGGGGGVAIINIDGRRFAEVFVPYLPGVVQEYGVG